MDHAERDRAFAELLGGVIERHAVASRLQATVVLAEEILGAALRVGDGVRRTLRDGGSGRPNDDDCRQLESLATRLEKATDVALGETTACALRRAAAGGEAAEAARLALQLFAGLTRPAIVPASLYVGLTVRRRVQRAETLVHPGALALEIQQRSREGLPTSSAAGGEPEAAGPILPEPIPLAASFAASGSEIALRRPTLDLRPALLEDSASGDLLVFTERLNGPFSVVLARAADDEWWAASSTPYERYSGELIEALSSLGIVTELGD